MKSTPAGSKLALCCKKFTFSTLIKMEGVAGKVNMIFSLQLKRL